MKKRLFSLSAPGLMAYMIIANAITNRVSNRNVSIPFDNVHYYNTKNGNVCYLKFDCPDSEKKPVLLLHELYPGFSAEEWRKTAVRLSKTRTVYAIDLPGCGRSDKPKLSYTRYLYVQLINHFINDITGNGIDVIASGGSFATAILADRMNPDAFDHIIAVNPPSLHTFGNYPGYLHTITRAILRSPIFGTYIYNMNFSSSATTNRLVNKGFYDIEKLDPKFVRLVYQSAHYDYQQAKYLYAALTSRYLNLDIIESLHLYHKKLYFIFGSAYEDYRQVYESYRAQISGAGMYVIGNTAKFPHLEDPRAFCKVIERLL